MPKKRSHGEGALYYIKSRKLWRGVIDIGYKPDGTRNQKYVHAKTQTEARKKLDTLKAEIQQHGAPLDKTTTVEAWAHTWLETVCRQNLKPSALKSYTSMINRWINPTIGKRRLNALRPSDIREVTKAITDAGRSQDLAMKARTVMSSMLEDARLEGMVARNVVRDVVAPKLAESDRTSLSLADTFALLRTSAQTLDGTRWWFAILTGMRQGERSGATLDSIDLDNMTFTVRWSLTEAKFEHGCEAVGGSWACGKKRGGSCPERHLIMAPGEVYRQLDGRLCLVRPKSGKPRTFPLPPVLVEPLKRYLEATIDRPNPHGLIWRNEDGSPITSGQDQQEFRNLMHAAGLITKEQTLEPCDRPAGTPKIPTTHWARHTTSTMLRELGTPAVTVGAIVGHGSERMTDRYTHADAVSAEARHAMEAFGEKFSRALES